MQKILTLVWFKIYPSHFGGQKGVALFNKYLAEHFEVDCLCSADNEEVPDAGCQVLPLLPVGKGQFFNPANWRKIIRFYKKKKYSFLILEFPYYGLLGACLKSKRTKLIIHMHNIESERFKSMRTWGWPLLSLYEKWSLRHADLVLFKTEVEKKYAIDRLDLRENQCYLLPYGLEAAGVPNRQQHRNFLMQTYGIKPEEKILLFAGTIDYPPNAAAVEAIYKQIVPLLNQQGTSYKILICGRNQSLSFTYIKSLRNEQVIQTGFVENITPYFGGADVFINPVQQVHGVQTKIFDALNFNLNVVSFDSAADALPHYLHEKVFMSPKGDYVHFTMNIKNALEKRSNVPEAFYQNYSWKAIAHKFANHLKRTFDSANTI